MANYLKSSEHVPEMRSALASYYTAADGSSVVGAVARARPGLHPVVQKGLGIDPTVDLTTKELANLLDGLRADGKPIGKAPTKNTFLDFVFSAPKSYTVAAVFAGPRERALLEKAYTDAVNSLMDVIAADIGTASVGRTAGNRARNREPAHIAMVPIEHYTARPTYRLARNGGTELVEMLVPGDPQRHTHILTFNAAFTDESRITSLYQEGIGQRILEYGAIGQAFLAVNLRTLGVNVELDSTPSLTFNEKMARLTDIPREICAVFSKRHEDGEGLAKEMAAEKGLDFDKLSPDERATVLSIGVAQTREAKALGLKEYDFWMKTAKEHGYKHRSVLRPGAEQELRPASERHKQATEISLPLVAEHLNRRHVIEGSVPRIAAAKALIQTGIQHANEVNIITAAHRSEGIMQDGQKTEIHWAHDPEKRYARVTTQLAVEMEQEAVDLLRVAAADKSVVLSPEAVNRAVAKVEAEAKAEGRLLDFSQGHGAKQRILIDKVAEAGRAMVWIGAAGVGKSTALRVPISAWHDMGREVYGVTLAWRQTEGLKDAGVGKRHKRVKRNWEPVKDQLVSAGISSERTFALDPFLTKAERGEIKLTSNSTVIVDELGLVGTHQILRLARLQAKSGFQFVGLGDDLQCQAVSAGATIDLARRAFGADNVPELIDTIRQEGLRDREIAKLFREGKADEALARKDEDGTLIIVPGGYSEAVQATVDLWWQRTKANTDNPEYSLGISVPSNADGRAVGLAIRDSRRAASEIGRDLCEIDASDQNGTHYKMKLAAGDRVRLFDRVRGPGEDGKWSIVGNNGTVVTVLDANSDGMKVVAPSGRVSNVGWEALRKDDGPIRLSYGDAVTIDARQSDTVSEHITVMPSGSAAVNGFGIYTADSRHKVRSWIITSQGAEKQEVISRRSLGDPRNQETAPAKIKAAILENLSRNLSRQPKKTLALDFLDKAVGLKSGTIDARLAAWFRQETRQAEDKPPLAVAAKQEAKAEAAAPVAEIAQSVTATAKPSADSQPMTPDDWRRAMEEPASVKSTPETPQETKPQMSAVEVQAEFARVLEMEGFRLKGAPVMDGKWHRVAVDGDKGAQKSGSYRGWDRGGIMNNFRGGEPITWKPDGGSATMTQAERDAQRASDMASRLADQAERNVREDKVANDAAVAWKASKPAHPKHAYLVRKQIAPHGLRQGAAGQVVPMTDGKEMKIGGRLIVPLRDGDGKLWNIQIIGQDGSKIFLPGRKRGLSATIGPMTPTGPVMIAEGFASAATLYNTTSLTSVAAIDSGNLLAVAASIRAKYPEKPIIFGADNDHHLPKRTPAIPNVGIEKATEAAAHVGGVVVAPQFSPDDKSTDWNDVHVTMGKAAARKAVEAAFADKGISQLLPVQTPELPKQITQADRDAAWARAKPRVSRKPAAPTSAVRETQKPTHTPGG